MQHLTREKKASIIIITIDTTITIKINVSYQQFQKSDCKSVQSPRASQTTDSCCPGSTSRELRDVSVGRRIFRASESWGRQTRQRLRPARQSQALRDRGISWTPNHLHCWMCSASAAWQRWRRQLNTYTHSENFTSNHHTSVQHENWRHTYLTAYAVKRG